MNVVNEEQFDSSVNYKGLFMIRCQQSKGCLTIEETRAEAGIASFICTLVIQLGDNKMAFTSSEHKRKKLAEQEAHWLALKFVDSTGLLPNSQLSKAIAEPSRSSTSSIVDISLDIFDPIANYKGKLLEVCQKFKDVRVTGLSVSEVKDKGFQSSVAVVIDNIEYSFKSTWQAKKKLAEQEAHWMTLKAYVDMKSSSKAPHDETQTESANPNTKMSSSDGILWPEPPPKSKRIIRGPLPSPQRPQKDWRFEMSNAVPITASESVNDTSKMGSFIPFFIS